MAERLGTSPHPFRGAGRPAGNTVTARWLDGGLWVFSAATGDFRTYEEVQTLQRRLYKAAGRQGVIVRTNWHRDIETLYVQAFELTAAPSAEEFGQQVAEL